MRAELPILSFTLVAFLTFIVSLNLKRSSVANLTLVGWLLVCNLLHAINSVIWANNVAIQVPAWCDIGRFKATIDGEPFQSFPHSDENPPRFKCRTTWGLPMSVAQLVRNLVNSRSHPLQA